MSGKKKTHCVRGHEYTKETTRYQKDKNGVTHRRCKLCQKISRLERKLYVELSRTRRKPISKDSNSRRTASKV